MFTAKLRERGSGEFLWLAILALAALLVVVAVMGRSAAAVGPQSDEPKPEPKPLVITVHSPVEGVFLVGEYPGSAPYVQVGTPVSPNTVVCGVDPLNGRPMQLTAGVFGTVAEVLAEDSQIVSVGRPLLIIRQTPPPVEP